jgi:hypothetical protein
VVPIGHLTWCLSPPPHPSTTPPTHLRLDTWMLPLSRNNLGPSLGQLSKRPVLTLFGDGFTVWKWHAQAAEALFLRGDAAGVCGGGRAFQDCWFVYLPWQREAEEKALCGA